MVPALDPCLRAQRAWAGPQPIGRGELLVERLNAHTSVFHLWSCVLCAWSYRWSKSVFFLVRPKRLEVLPKHFLCHLKFSGRWTRDRLQLFSTSFHGAVGQSNLLGPGFLLPTVQCSRLAGRKAQHPPVITTTVPDATAMRFSIGRVQPPMTPRRSAETFVYAGTAHCV